MKDLIKATGLWKTGNGKALTGSLGGIRVVVFKNNFKKEGSREPDYELYFGESIKKAASSEIEPIGSSDPFMISDVPHPTEPSSEAPSFTENVVHTDTQE